MDEVKVECPYCSFENTVGDLFEYHNDEEVEWECESCEETFYFQLEMFIEYEASNVKKFEDRDNDI